MSEGIFIQLGSNIGDRASYLKEAIGFIALEIGTVVLSSSIYETAAWGLTDQNDFLNQVIQVKSTLSPMNILESCLSIEKKMRRVRMEKWGPRNIDLDLLFYHDKVMHSARLTLPHPRITERKFVLIPMCEIAPYFIHPVENVTCADLLRICQ